MKKHLKTLFTILYILFAISKLSAQDISNLVLGSIDNENFYLTNYFMVYAKNNEKAESYNPDYLDLYINYKTKVKEAIDLNYHKDPNFINELNGYFQQLAKAGFGPELDRLMDEYFAGILLYNLTDKMVWSKATSNPEEMFLFYKSNKNRYQGNYQKIEELEGSDEKSTILSDFQNELENKFVYEIRKKHKIEINEDIKNRLPYYFEIYKKEKNNYEYKNEYTDYMPDLESKMIDSDEVIAAYERMKWEVNVAHILIKCSEDAPASDTLIAYNKALNAQKRILNNESFDQVAKEVSEDPSAQKNGGNLGYFGAFAMVYPFETTCYKLTVGNVSNPIRTKFGYHIIKLLDKRPFQGSIQVAHIMTKEESEANNVYQMLMNGGNFEQLAKDYSIDKQSGEKGGILPYFTTGKMIPEFEKAAFSLKTIGAYTKPVQTQFGWHIIKLIDQKSLEPFTVAKTEIESKLTKESPKYVKFTTMHYPVKLVKEVNPPILSVSDIAFNDQNNNNRIDGNEECTVNFRITNNGKGSANNLNILVQQASAITGLSFNASTSLKEILPNSFLDIQIPITGSIGLTSGTANFKISFTEQLGFTPDPFELNIETKEFTKPEIKVVDYSFLTDNGTLKLGLPIQLKVLVQNTGQGIGEGVKVNFTYPQKNVFPNGDQEFIIGTLQPGVTKELIFEFIANKLYTEKDIPIGIKVGEKYKLFGQDKEVIANLDTKSSGNSINIASSAKDEVVKIEVASLTADVDKNIPINPTKYPNRLALIIGNEDYKSRQTGLSSESNVYFAINDATIFKDYCINTFGIEEKNIFFITNATAGEMSQKIDLVAQILTRLGEKGELIFYYAGHGFPDENTKIPYLIPVDVNAANLNAAIKLYDVYNKLAASNAKRITVFLDACFTGGGRDAGLIAARGVKIQPKAEAFKGNLVVFAATSADQSALPYKEKQHGMFTYFLLKKIQESNGDITYDELGNSVQENVSIESLRINNKPQDPKINLSIDVQNDWKTWKIK
jgi:parvulin-like peptidyl-prolyl isomerase